jgi:hypothetical protein
MVTDDPSRGPEAPWQTPDPTADPKARSRRTGLGAPAIPQDTTPHLRAVHVALGMTPGAGVTPTPLPMMVEAGMTLEEAKGRLSMAETGTAPPAPPPAPPWVPNAPSDPLLRPRRVMQDDSPNWCRALPSRRRSGRLTWTLAAKLYNRAEPRPFGKSGDRPGDREQSLVVTTAPPAPIRSQPLYRRDRPAQPLTEGPFEGRCPRSHRLRRRLHR